MQAMRHEGGSALRQTAHIPQLNAGRGTAPAGLGPLPGLASPRLASPPVRAAQAKPCAEILGWQGSDLIKHTNLFLDKEPN